MANRDVKRGTEQIKRTSPTSLPPHRASKLRSFFGVRPTTHSPHRSGRGWDRDRDRDDNRDNNDHRHSDRHHHHKKQHTYVKVDLRDLDYLLDPFSLTIRVRTRASKLESFIRGHYDARRHPVSDVVRIIFYLDGKELQCHSVVDQPSTIWYRVMTTRDDGAWKITRRRGGVTEKSSRVLLNSQFTSDLARAIETGETVGGIRRKIAEHMGVEDYNRIIILVQTGMRPGLIQCDSWQARQIRTWLCHWLSIDVSRSNGYVILEGLGRRYIYHPEPSYLRKGLDLKRVKRWMEQRLFTFVGPLGRNRPPFKAGQIVFTRGGRRLSSRSLVEWGTVYSFTLDDAATDALANEESWLLPLTETCSVCADNKKITDLPIRITANCDHKPALCKDCMRQWIHSSLGTTSWDRLKCPECPRLLEFHDVKRCASPSDFLRYDTFATRAALTNIQNFKWCISPNCGSGQIHDASCPKIRCTKCKSKQCAVHNVPWHAGETCQEYDKRNLQRQKEEEASEEVIQKTSKKCPECQKDVHKWTGCNHITCVCGHEWCYVCSAPFKQNQHGFLYCRHNPGCTEHDPFIDIIDPPRDRPPATAVPANFRFPPPLLRPRPWQLRGGQEARRGPPPAPPGF